MKKFNWEDFLNINKLSKIAVHCKTEEEAKDFCKQMHERGIGWISGYSLKEKNRWHYKKENTCYALTRDHDLTIKCWYNAINHFVTEEYTILEWSEYMQEEKKEFTKSDLKYGYMVKLEDGRKALYMPSETKDFFDFCNKTQCIAVDDYNEGLKYTGIFSKYDVVEVRGFAPGYKTTTLDESERPLIWKREEEIIITHAAKTLLENVDEKYKWIAKNKNGEVRMYCDKPKKQRKMWVTPSYSTSIAPFNQLFDFTSWKDEEPWNIEELLKIAKVKEK